MDNWCWCFSEPFFSHVIVGSMYVSGNLPTYPSPNLTFGLKQEVGLGRGRWAVSQKHTMFLIVFRLDTSLGQTVAAGPGVV